MRHIKAAGILVTRGQPVESFLLLRHRDRWDLPKGHLDAGETEIQCALRELEEETGIRASDIELDGKFQWSIEYDVDSKRFGERQRAAGLDDECVQVELLVDPEEKRQPPAKIPRDGVILCARGTR